MPNIFSNNYLTRRPIEYAMRDFAKHFDPRKKILDIGCGGKPYARYFICEYIGLDPSPLVQAEIVALSSNIPSPDNTFDGVILNQALEHISDTEKTIAEIKRVLKPGGLCMVTVPQTVLVHGTPLLSERAPFHNFDTQRVPFWIEDYYRFTRFGLITLFQGFQTVSLKGDTYFFGTIFQLFNYFLAAFGLDEILFPLYFINNCLGLLFDSLAVSLSSLPFSFLRKFRLFILEALPINTVAIFKKQ